MTGCNINTNNERVIDCSLLTPEHACASYNDVQNDCQIY